MKAGHIDGVIKFARIIKEAGDSLQASSLAVVRISAQLESDDDLSGSTEAPRPPRPNFVNRVWGRLTSSNRQKEWHVVRSGPNYELDPKKRLGQIPAYLSKLDPLR